MKILFIQDSLGTGGAEKSNLELWYYLQKKNSYLKIVVLEHRSKGIENEVLEANFEVTFLENKSFWQSVKDIVKIINEFKPDIVHSVLFRATIRTRLAKLKSKFYHIESLVNTPYTIKRFKDPKINGLGFLFAYFIDLFTHGFGVDHFHANGSTVLKHYKKFLLVSKSKFTLINRGRKPNDFLVEDIIKSNLRNELTTRNAFQIVLVGRQEYQKGIDIAIKALYQALKNIKSLKLILVGREGNHSVTLTRLIDELQLHHNIVFLGHRNDVDRILASSDLFLFTSRFEGFPGVLVEALSAGLPIVCSNIPNNHEIVEDSMNGLFFEVDNAEDCSLKILDLINNPVLMDKMKAQNLAKFDKLYKIEEINTQMLGMYKNLIKRYKS